MKKQFHDASRLSDPLSDFIGAKDVVYRSLRSVPSQDQVDNRFYSPDRNVDVPTRPVPARSVARVLLEVTKKRTDRVVFLFLHLAGCSNW